MKQAEHTISFSSLLRNETGKAGISFFNPVPLSGECCTPRWDSVACGRSFTL